MSFKNLNIKIEYETIIDEVVEDFYIPVLKESCIYKRAVGFFSSSIFLQLTNGLSSLLKNNGKMQLLISPKLDEKDYEAIKNGYDIRDAVSEKIVSQFDELVEYEQKNDRFGMLSYMISSGLLDIKVVALEKDNDKAMFHEKLGIMVDNENNYICFSGSLNDSNTAVNLNYEAIDVYCSWKSQDAELRCTSKELRFNRMWNGIEKGLITIDFPEIIKKKLLSFKKEGNDYSEIDEIYLKNIHSIKDKVVTFEPTTEFLKDGLRDYQLEAINNWKNNNYRGIFDMATGTGKTFTGCGAITELFKDKQKLFVIICCPYIHLVDQWCDEVVNFNINPIKCYGGIDYKKSLERNINKFKHNKINFVCVIVANKTFSSDYFQNIIHNIVDNCLIVVDEAHNFGSFKLKECMNVEYPYRLALSATLDRYGDEDGTKILYNFFGNKCYTYSLERAIKEKKLCEYIYKPILVYLDSDELEEYCELTKKIGKLSHGSLDSDYIKRLLIKRARLIAGCHSKIDVLINLIKKDYYSKNNILIYCGAVKYGEDDYENCSDEKKQIEAVISKLNNDLNFTCVKFTSDENSSQRKDIIKSFKEKLIQGIVAIKCLDEGMNIPAIETAFILASSTNPKEYIQRRGRVLRLSPGKDYAVIYDFITLPYNTDITFVNPDLESACQGLVKKELIRMIDFNNLSKFPHYNNDIITDIKSVYGLYTINEYEEVSKYE